MKSVLVLYPNQLFAVDRLPQVDTVMMVEEPRFFGVDQELPQRLHKQKLILLRAAMRRYVEEVLWPTGVNVDYVDLDVLMKTGEIFDRLKKFEHIYMFDPVDEVLTTRLLQARRERPDVPAVEFLPSPNFYLKDQEARQYFAEKHRQPFAEFYQWQRERFNVLIGDDYKPVGGKWMFDDGKQQKLPATTPPPSFAAFGSNKWVAEATTYVNEHFPNNPGSTDFIWPTSHAEAQTWLKDFVSKRLASFSVYAEALDANAAWMYHSALGSSLNMGLLSPQEVIAAALQQHAKEPLPLESLEAFIRRVLGWREYERGQYVVRSQYMRSNNSLGHKRKMTNAWYDGTLGIPPFDDVVKKVNQHAYAHNVERTEVLGNLMILCEIDPADIYTWFAELFIDAFDWSVLPVVYALNQAADDLTTKPHITSSNVILQMSHYERGEWNNIWDGLYWRFVENHKDMLGKNPSMRPIVARLNRLDPDRKRIIHYRAEDFLARVTQ